MIYIETADKSELLRDEREIFRYLGYGNSEPDEYTAEKVKMVSEEVFDAVTCRACFLVTDITCTEETVDFGAFSVHAKALAKNLDGCKKAVLLGATVGAQVDRIIGKYSRISPASAVIAQAAGAAAIESFCDLVCLRIKDAFRKENLFLRPRFSPGYGDFSLTYQNELFRYLDCTKKIGLSLTEGLMMTPTKSVTAIIGLGTNDTNCHKSGCEFCERQSECDYSRG